MTSSRGDPIEDAESAETSAGPDRALRVYWSVLIVLQTAMAVEFILLLLEQQWLNAVLVAGIIALIMAPALLAPRLHVRIPPEFQLLAVAFVFATLFLGEILQYYDRFPWWDTALHAGSGLLLGVFGFLLIYVINENRKIDIQLGAGFVALFAFLFAVTVGTLWEIFEFAMDELFRLGMQSGGLGDTMWDLVLDGAGAAAISLFGWWYLRRDQRSFIERWVQKFIQRNPRMFRQ